MRIVITGTSGFIGSHLSAALRKNHEVVGLNRRPTPLDAEDYAWDFRSPLPEGLPRKADVIIHTAATDGRSAADPAAECFAVNTQATATLLAFAQQASVQQFIYLSTGSVYASQPTPCHERDPLGPIDHYAASKAAAECLAWGYANDFSVLCLRLFYPYGVGQRLPRLIPGLIERIRSGEPVRMRKTDGGPLLNPVHIRDVTQWIEKLLEQKQAGVFNLAGNETVSIRDLAETIGAALHTKVYFSPDEHQSENRLGDIRAIVAATGHSPQKTLAAGLNEMLNA